MKTKKRISDSGAIIIIDLPITIEKATSIKKELILQLNASNSVNGREVLIINEIEEIDNLKQMVYTLEPTIENTLFLYPGKSAQFIRSLKFSCNYKAENVFAKRIWIPATEPKVMVGNIYSKQFIDSQIKQIIVVDDVISSGATISLLYKRNAWKYPNAVWHTVVLLSRKEQISHFEHVLSCYQIEDVDGRKPPINSLSTLLDNPEIISNYLKRNFINAQKLENYFKEFKYSLTN